MATDDGGRRRRRRTTSSTVETDRLVELLESHCTLQGGLCLGQYEQMTSPSVGHRIPQMLLWYTTLLDMIVLAPTANIAWARMKEALLILYDRYPKYDPFLKHRDHTNVSSAAWIARSVRILLAHVRRMRLRPERLQQGLLRCTSAEDKEKLQHLASQVQIDEAEQVVPTSSSSGVSAEGSGRSLKAHVSIASSEEPQIAVSPCSSSVEDIDFTGLEHCAASSSSSSSSLSASSVEKDMIERQCVDAPLFVAQSKQALKKDSTQPAGSV